VTGWRRIGREGEDKGRELMRRSTTIIHQKKKKIQNKKRHNTKHQVQEQEHFSLWFKFWSYSSSIQS
jgi:hypothetical protein